MDVNTCKHCFLLKTALIRMQTCVNLNQMLVGWFRVALLHIHESVMEACGAIEIMVACGSLPCLRFLRFSCLAERPRGFAGLLSGCLLLLQSHLAV